MVSPGEDAQDAVVGSLAHSGAHMLFGKPNSPYRSAFGSGRGLGSPLDAYLSKVSKGHKAIDKSVKSLFGGDNTDLYQAGDKEHIKEYVEKGGLDKDIQMFASGGDVKEEDPLASQLPQHNILLNASKMRVANYLNSVKPNPIQPQMPFDRKPSTTTQDKEYDRAVHIASQPLSVLQSIKKGSITPSAVKHLNSMYPELSNHLSKKLTEEITKAQLEGRKPSYRTRQGLSLFMGAHLDSTFTPQSITAAQAVFAQQQAQQQQAPQKNKKGTSTLSKASEQYETSSQAAETRKRQ